MSLFLSLKNFIHLYIKSILVVHIFYNDSIFVSVSLCLSYIIFVLHIHSFLFILGIAPGQGNELLKLIHEPEQQQETSSSKLDQRVVKLYCESTDKAVKKRLLSMIACSHTKKQLQQIIPSVTMHAINEARKHAVEHSEGIVIHFHHFMTCTCIECVCYIHGNVCFKNIISVIVLARIMINISRFFNSLI